METPDLIGKLDELIAQQTEELDRLKAARSALDGECKTEAKAKPRKRDANGLTSGQRAARTRRYRKAGRKAAETRKRNDANKRAEAAKARENVITPGEGVRDGRLRDPDAAQEQAMAEEEARAKAAGEVPTWAQ